MQHIDNMKSLQKRWTRLARADCTSMYFNILREAQDSYRVLYVSMFLYMSCSICSTLAYFWEITYGRLNLSWNLWTIWKPQSFSGISIFISCMECNEYNQSIGTCQISSRFTKSCRVHEQSIWTNLSFPTLQAHPSVPLIDWTDSRRWLGFHHWGLVGLQYTAASPWKKGGMAWDGEHFFHRSYRTMDVSSYCIYYTFNILYYRYHVSLYIICIYQI